MKLLTLAWAAVVLTTVADGQTSNSLVRFRISYGTTFFGNIDVELFDQEKPLTVSNFLANVQNNIYDNSILHDLRPGFTVQGGAARVANPFSPQPFELVERIPTNAPIANEFGVGPLHSNTKGTLAMAKNPNDTNSSSASWFFNLGNNGDGFGVTNLDASLGGYTVFGRVTAGLNVLNTFNTFTEGHGVLDMTNDFHTLFCPPLRVYPDDIVIGFDALPVGFFGEDCINYSDLFNVEVMVISGSDVTPPKLAFLFPPANSTVEAEVIPVAGTVTDNVGVESVRVYANTNPPVPASGTAIWSALITNLPPGTNLVVAEATDTSGVRAQASLQFFRSVRVPFSLTKIGNGTIAGPADGALLEVNRGYSLTATPAAGYLFAGWTGTISQASATLPFLMDTNLALTAIFVTNAFPSVMGIYNGLFYNTNDVEQDSSGFLTLTLGNLGAYSAKILMNGRTYRFSGHFSPDGGETNLLFRTGTNALLIRMAVDVLNGTDHLIGSITNNQVSAIDTNAGWLAELQADRAVFTPANPASLAGAYTLLIPPDPVDSGPDGHSFGRVTMSTKGVVSLAGTLADGTKAAQRVTVSKTGAWPLYLSLYKDQGALVSWVMFDTNQLTTDFSGMVNWFKQSQPKAKIYPLGFTNESAIAGSRYTSPPSGTRALDLPDAVVGFTNGNLTASFANDVTIGTDNKVVNGSANALTLTIPPRTGLFRGSVTPPAGGAAQPFKGAVLQKQNRAAGFLLGPNQSSGVTINAP